jgi:hypothetical protein
MTSDAEITAAMARKAKKKPPETYETCVFEIADWEPHYHLSTNAGPHDERLYWEHTSVQIIAKCIFPAKFSGRASKLVLAGDRNLLQPEILKCKKAWRPSGIGTLTARNESGWNCCLGLPVDISNWRLP